MPPKSKKVSIELSVIDWGIVLGCLRILPRLFKGMPRRDLKRVDAVADKIEDLLTGLGCKVELTKDHFSVEEG